MKATMLLTMGTAVMLGAGVPTTEAALRSTDSQRRKLEDHRGQGPPFMDPTNCSANELAAMLHTRNTDPEFVDAYVVYHTWLHNERMDETYWNALMEKTPQDLFTTIPRGDFIFWGFKGGNFEMSAYNEETSIVHEEFHQINGIGNAWSYQSPSNYDMDEIKATITLDDGADYVVFTSSFFDQYQHILIDHLGYLAYLRKILPPTTKFILVDVKGENQTHGTHHGQHILELLDPEFAKRVHWITCANMRHCNQHIQVRANRSTGKGGSLTLFRPPVATRHVQLLAMAREWILSTYPPTQSSLEKKTIVYYTRNHADALNGRAMDVEQENVMIGMMKSMLQRYNRPEKLVIFDGSLSLKEQVDLFQSATIVIGPHGGGLANMLFMLPSGSPDCADRPKVLEFVTSAATPDVQDGLRWMTYYNMYATTAWVEFHNILYAPGSTKKSTFVDLDSFHDALVSTFGNTKRNAITAI
jgi:hypothetical protein